MGVPAFFRWLTKKYPSIIVNANEERQRGPDGKKIPIDCTQPNPNFQEFDNLYLDMNGIIHPCTHPEDRPAPKNEDEMFALIFEYIDRIFSIVRPRRLLYMAIDGVAPRAKMNQQRSRRFRASKEAAEKEESIEAQRNRLLNEGIALPPRKEKEEHFDSNCITPGTPFMARLADALKYYIHDRITNDAAWAKIEVILSDANVPGEGEHKIMDFVRKQRSNPAHDPDTVHCLCGADADLIMLGLATHEANFNIIREEFVPNQPRACELCGQYGHELKECRGMENDADRGEDYVEPEHREKNFIFLRIPVLREYLEKDLAMPNLPFKFNFERVIDDWVFLCFFVGNDFLPHLPSLEIREGAIDRLIKLYKEMVYQIKGYLTKDGDVELERVQMIMCGLGEVEDEIFKRRQQDEERFKAIQRNKKMRMNNGRGRRGAPAYVPQRGSIIAPLSRPTPMSGSDTRSLAADARVQAMNFSQNEEAAQRLKMMLKGEGNGNASAPARGPVGPSNPRKRHADEPVAAIEDEDEGPPDEIRLFESGWKDRYYKAKFDVSGDDVEFRHTVAWAYVEGLCWVLRYYYQGCASWDWYFPYHYAPFASDFDTVGSFVPTFDSRKTKPFKPLEQLMSVFPAASKQHLPTEWQKLMTEDDSPIIDLYPVDFRIDLNGKKYAWQGVALLPFVDEKRLLETLKSVYASLTNEENERNTTGPNRIFIGRNHPAFDFFRQTYESENGGKIDLDSKLLYGLSGKVSRDQTVVMPGEPFPSPVSHESCQDLPVNCAIMVIYEDPEYPEGFKFPAVRLEKAKELERTLKPGDWNERRDGQYRPMIGFSRDTPRAQIDNSGHRHFEHHVRQSIPQSNQGINSGHGGGYQGGYGSHRGSYGNDRHHGGYNNRNDYQQQPQRGGYNSYNGRGGGSYRGGGGYNSSRGGNEQSRGGYQGGFQDAALHTSRVNAIATRTVDWESASHAEEHGNKPSPSWRSSTDRECSESMGGRSTKATPPRSPSFFRGFARTAAPSVEGLSDSSGSMTSVSAPDSISPLLPKRRSRRSEMTEQSLVQKLRSYPPAVFFMLGNEFCERFSFYGMKTILFIYFITEHQFSASKATFIYHAFSCIAYLTPLIGSLLADSVFGRFKVILYGSSIYVFGHVLLSGGAIPFLGYELRSVLDFSGLFVIAFATGCIKPCVSAFAADQFTEEQADLRAQFFSFFYFAINGGSLLAILITPTLRGRVQCFGNPHCFPLAFGVPGVLMLLALLLFLGGWNMYRKHPPSKENVGSEVVQCIYTGAKRSLLKRSSDKPVSHWLDRAAPDHSQEMINAVKGFCAVALIFSPLVFFWALFDQQGSTWVQQARRLDGRVGVLSILPEQIHALNPICVLILVPLFEGWIYPALRKVVRVTPLRKMAVGGLLTAAAFAIAGLLQLKVNETMEVPPEPGRVFIQRIGNETLLSGFHGTDGVLINQGVLPSGRTEIDADVYKFNSGIGNEQMTLNASVAGKGYVMAVFRLANQSNQLTVFDYKVDKADNGATRIYVVTPAQQQGNIFAVNYKNTTVAQCSLTSGSFLDIIPGIISRPEIRLYWGNNCSAIECPNMIQLFTQMGAVFVLHIHENTTEEDFSLLVRPNTVSILWSLPQYIIITLGEVLLSVTGLEFAYSQAAPNMKSVLTALWLLTVFAGNLIDMMISGTHLIPQPELEFFFYSVLMFLVMGVFIVLSLQYTYSEDRNPEIEEEMQKHAPPIVPNVPPPVLMNDSTC
ncbi:unnamed protein product [Caenorhabditis auriculariae]|uniref:5'-3' exoribonuclease 2 homolog n=1 Tax=Caenorhabditis auriculariae TaxID=2777116 RepID=A0A8S1GPA3_9PELO|nr:unnamed protein product [Caenorhabditis auriculariae]